MTGSVSSLPRQPRALVIGVGNGYRGDDAVGLMVAQRLQRSPSTMSPLCRLPGGHRTADAVAGHRCRGAGGCRVH